MIEGICSPGHKPRLNCRGARGRTSNTSKRLSELSPVAFASLGLDCQREGCSPPSRLVVGTRESHSGDSVGDGVPTVTVKATWAQAHGGSRPESFPSLQRADSRLPTDPPPATDTHGAFPGNLRKSKDTSGFAHWQTGMNHLNAPVLLPGTRGASRGRN